MSVPDRANAGTTNILSNSLLNDSGFWNGFWEDDCHILDSNIKVDKENTAISIIVPNDEEIYSKTNKDTLVPLFNKSNEVNKKSKNFVDQYLHFSKLKQKRENLHVSKLKKYKYRSKLPPNIHTFTYISNSYLYKIKYHIETYAENTVPILTIKDISKAKQYSIFNELFCRNLYEINGIIFKNVICRATIVGIVKQGDGYKLLIDDGTASMWCSYKRLCYESDNVDNFPMIECIDIPSHHVTPSSNFKRGTIVQILGTLDIYHRKFLIKKLYSEENILVRRELLYLQYLLSLTNMYSKWKQDISNIYNV